MKQSDLNVYLSLATAPFLLGYLAWRLTSKALEDIGQASEEIFRGDRLPVLHFPPQDKPDPH